MTNLNPPPSEIYLMRHAHSGWPQPGERDFDRTLDSRGMAEAEAVGRMATSSGYRPDLILCSSAQRCRQTAFSIATLMGDSIPVNYLDELYNASFETYLRIIQAQNCPRLMILGHNPAIEVLLEALIGADATATAVPAGLPTAGFAVITQEGGTASASWQLRAFLSP